MTVVLFSSNLLRGRLEIANVPFSVSLGAVISSMNFVPEEPSMYGLKDIAECLTV